MNNIQFDLKAAARFLYLLDSAASSFTFQTFDDKADRQDRRLVRVLHGTLPDHAAELTKLNSQGAGIFVTVNETDGRGRKSKNIVRVRAVLADLDGAPLAPVMACTLPPHIVIETSPGRWHCYWLITGLLLNQFHFLQKAIAARFNADPGVSGLPCVARLPGFFHRKREPFLVRFVTITERLNPYPASDFQLPRVSRHKPRPQTAAGPLDVWLTTEALRVIPNANLGWVEWNRVGLAVWRATGGSDLGFRAFDEFSQKSPKYDRRRTRLRWQGYFKSPPNRIGTGTLIFLANASEPGWYDKRMRELMDEVLS